MPRLKPRENREQHRVQVQLNISRELSELILQEQVRVNVKNKTDLIIMILEQYFEEPVEGEENEEPNMPVKI